VTDNINGRQTETAPKALYGLVYPALNGRRPETGVLVSGIRSSHPFAAGAVANFGFERTLETYDSSVVLVRKFSWRTRGGNEENFRTTTLVLAGFGKFDFDSQLDFGQHRVKGRIAGG
jgi:hypothetical protein